MKGTLVCNYSKSNLPLEDSRLVRYHRDSIQFEILPCQIKSQISHFISFSVFIHEMFPDL